MSSSEHTARQTPLHETHIALGASMTGFAGWSMPLRYGSETAEHTAVRTTAGLFDLTHMGEIEVTGPAAGPALNFALVSDIEAIAVGKAKYTMICEPGGGILDDLIVYRLAEQRYLVVANAANTAVVLPELRARAEAFDAEVHDRCADWALLAVQGPRSTAVLAACTDTELSEIPYYAAVPATVTGGEVLLARTGYTGEDGFEVFCAPADAGRIWTALHEAGQPHGLLPAGLACRDTLRLEAGMPLYGHELSAELTPYDAGLGRVVKLGKPGDFVGKAALAAAAERAVRRRLVGLLPAGRRPARAEYAVLDPADGAPIGVVTSGAPSPTLGRPVAMSYVDAAFADPGTAVEVDVRGRPEPAEVTALPFYRRAR